MSWLRDIDRWFLAHVLPYEPDFLRRARRLMGNREDAQDLVQEAYARILSGDGWRQLSNPGGYVARIVQNLAVERIRHARVVTLHQAANVDALDGDDNSPDALAQVSGDELLRHLAAAIEGLPVQCRQVVVMRKIQDVPPREIAAQLGIALSTVEKHLARGLALLAAAMSEADAGHADSRAGRNPTLRHTRD